MVDWKIPLFKTYSDQEDIDAVSNIVRRGTYWAVGPEIEEFEKKIAEYTGVKYALAFNSGTSALHSLLLIHDVKDKEVIVPSFSFIATANAVVLAGGNPIFAESEEETFGLDADDVKKKITEKTKAIICLHYGGFPSRDIKKLRKIADENNLILIEDSAESIGSEVKGKKIGSFGHSSIFSFCQNKVLALGEGGMITTDSQEIYEKAKLIRCHGRVEESEDYFSYNGSNDYINTGYNFRMPTILAALGISQLNKIQKIIDLRREKGKYLSKHLSKIPEIEIPKEIENHYQVYQMYTIKLPDKEIRNGLQEHLNKKEIMSKIYFDPIHLKTIYMKKYFCNKGDLPKTENLSERVLNIPLFPSIKKEELDYMIESIKEYFYKKETLTKIIISPETSIKNAMKLIDETGKKIVIVADEKNKLKGIASDSDIRRGLLNGFEIDEEISKIMNENPKIIFSENYEEEIKEKIKKDKVRELGIPVVNKNKEIKDFIFLSKDSEIKHLQGLENSESKSFHLKKILIIGGAGYIGSILVRSLLKKGYEVVVLDKFIYGKESLEKIDDSNLQIIEGDTRHIEDVTLAAKDVDAVVHLAELVGDPACELNPQSTQEINYLATKNIATVCKRFQINRLVYISSCSVYGASKNNGFLKEDSEVNPVSLYAKMKLASEKAIEEMKDENFSPTILRLGTVFGSSHRPRFDLVVNLLTAKALKERKITIFGGDQWRPNVHVGDVSNTIISVLEAPIKKIRGQIFNVGSEENNHTIENIGNFVNKIIPESEKIISKEEGDKRDYKVDFSKLKKCLDIRMEKNIEKGVEEIKDLLEKFPEINYTDSKYSNILSLKNNSEKKGKILFIVHDVHQDDNEFPLGIGYLASVLKKACHEVQIYSQDVFHQSNEELAKFLEENEFDMIGLGFLAARYVETIRPLSKIINQHKKNAKFILGGQGVSAIPEYVLRDTQADIAVIGEGEKIIVPLVEKILNKEKIENQKGIAFRNENQIIVNERESPLSDLDEIPFPAWELFPIEKYSSCYSLPGSLPKDKTLAVITSRGCVNKGSFCYRMEKGIRLRKIEKVFEEIKILNEKYGITYFHFGDEMFVPNKERIKEFVNKLKELKNPIRYYSQSRIELAKDKEILKMLKESGCQMVNLGLESLDQNVLDLMGKRTKAEDNYLAVQNVIEAGMHPGLNFIWANPGDSIESLNKIVDFLIKYDTQGQLRTIRPPTPFPGAPLYYQAIKEGKLKGPGDFFEKFKNSDRMTVNFTNMSDEEVYSALLQANTRLIKNYYQKIYGKKEDAEKLIENFRKLYFPACEEDLKFRGARHYDKKDVSPNLE